jgi:uncharacterized protein involved in exopolysaccharide biosynthesis
MRLSDYLVAARRSWWIVLLMIVLGIVGASAATSIGGKSYTSQTRVAVAPNAGLPLNASMIEIKPEKVATAAELVSGDVLMDRAAEQAGVAKSVADQYTASASASLRGSTVDVFVSGPDADVAAKLNAALVAAVSARYAELYVGYSLIVVDGPTIATSPSGPSRNAQVAVGAVIGLGVGMLIAIALESDRRARA